MIDIPLDAEQHLTRGKHVTATIDPAADVYTAIVSFTVEPDQQSELVEAIRTFSDEVVCHQPGFVSASVHASQDGTRVINYAQWATRDAYETFASNPDVASRMEAVAAFRPDGRPFVIVFQATAAA
jgi:quinol monooxygenase YgiN